MRKCKIARTASERGKIVGLHRKSAQKLTARRAYFTPISAKIEIGLAACADWHA
jgi:hypothetical protein